MIAEEGGCTPLTFSYIHIHAHRHGPLTCRHTRTHEHKREASLHAYTISTYSRKTLDRALKVVARSPSCSALGCQERWVDFRAHQRPESIGSLWELEVHSHGAQTRDIPHRPVARITMDHSALLYSFMLCTALGAAKTIQVPRALSNHG